jgi:cytochrome c556
MKRCNSLWIAAFVSSLFLLSPVWAQEGVIEKRQKLMKSNSAAAKALKKAVEEKDYSTVEAKAKDIAGYSDQINDLFPKGSTSEKSRAKAEIWEKWDEFRKDISQLKKGASDLADAAGAKDDGRVKVKFDDVGKACSSCHKGFRAEKKG